MAADLSRRSLVGSLVLHLVLVMGGIFFIFSTNAENAPIPLMEGEKSVRVVSRPVKVKAADKVVERPASPASQRLVGPKEPVISQAANTPPKVAKTSAVNQPTVSTANSYPQAKKVARAKRSPTKTPKPRPKEETFSSTPLGWGVPTPAPTTASTSGGEGGHQSKVTRRAMPISRPEFNLTQRFPELKSVKIKAEFKIKEDGSYEPTLMLGSGSPTADVVILAKLLEFKWRPALEKGVPVTDVRVLEIRLDG